MMREEGCGEFAGNAEKIDTKNEARSKADDNEDNSKRLQ
jgi:hypothetical protein